jgi:hypothetical protein
VTRLRVDNKSDAVDEARQNALSECYDMIAAIERDYQQPPKQCTSNEHCDTMVWAGLVKALVAQDLRPSPSPPFTGFSYSKVASDLGKLSIPTLCELLARYTEDRGYYYNHHHQYHVQKCGVKGTITTRLSSISTTLQGLELDQYCKKEQKVDDQPESS